MISEILNLLAVLFIVGAFGGLIAAILDKPYEILKDKTIISKSYKLWPYYKQCETLFPGVVLSVFLGGLSACIWWSLNNSFSSVIIMGDVHQNTNQIETFLTLGHLVASFFIGMGGSSYIISEAARRCADHK